MKEERLPVSIDPVRFAKAQRLCSGVINLRDLKRLCESMTSDQGVAKADLRFFSDEECKTVIELKLKTELSLSCQRCLGTVKLLINTCHYLSPVKGLEEAELLPSYLEPVWLEEDNLINPLVLIEDDLLLSIPLVPMHEEFDSECVTIPKELELDDLDLKIGAGACQSENPFAVLVNLKK